MRSCAVAGEPGRVERVDPEKWLRLRRLALAVDDCVYRAAMNLQSSHATADHYGLEAYTVQSVIAHHRPSYASRRTG